jgi:hypothetical protein
MTPGPTRCQGSFQSHIEKFQKEGYLSAVQFDSLRTILEAGHAVIHRPFIVTETQLNTALDIMEGILAAIYPHYEAAQILLDEIPERRRSKSQPER